QFGLPKFTVLGRIAVDRFAGSAMYGQVSLAVSVEIQSTQHDRPARGFFEDAGRYRLAVVFDQPRQRDVEREKLHRFLSIPAVSLWFSFVPLLGARTSSSAMSAQREISSS